MKFLVATNIVASRPPKRRPTGTPTARANLLTMEAVSSEMNFSGRVRAEGGGVDLLKDKSC